VNKSWDFFFFYKSDTGRGMFVRWYA